MLINKDLQTYVQKCGIQKLYADIDSYVAQLQIFPSTENFYLSEECFNLTTHLTARAALSSLSKEWFYQLCMKFSWKQMINTTLTKF